MRALGEQPMLFVRSALAPARLKKLLAYRLPIAEFMATYVETIFSCNSSAEVIGLLEVFLREFAQAGFSRQVPSELCPARIVSPLEVKTWSMRTRIALEQHANERKSPHDTLTSLEAVLSAASRRIESLAA
jgi:hypothetical protein